MEKEFLVEGEIAPSQPRQFVDEVNQSLGHIIPLTIDVQLRDIKVGKKLVKETVIKSTLWVTNIGLVKLATSKLFHISKIRVAGSLTSSERTILKSMATTLFSKLGGIENVNSK